MQQQSEFSNVFCSAEQTSLWQNYDGKNSVFSTPVTLQTPTLHHTLVRFGESTLFPLCIYHTSLGKQNFSLHREICILSFKFNEGVWMMGEGGRIQSIPEKKK